MWEKKLIKICYDLKIEPAAFNRDKKIIFICPKIPEEKIKINLVQMIPKDWRYEFVEGPKTITMETFAVILQQVGVITPPEIKREDHKLTVKAQVQTRAGLDPLDRDHPVWDSITDLFKNDGFFNSWNVTLNDVTVSYDARIAKEVQNQHNIREISIREDEITDLKILLETTEDVNDFLKGLK